MGVLTDSSIANALGLCILFLLFILSRLDDGLVYLSGVVILSLVDLRNYLNKHATNFLDTELVCE